MLAKSNEAHNRRLYLLWAVPFRRWARAATLQQMGNVKHRQNDLAALVKAGLVRVRREEGRMPQYRKTRRGALYALYALRGRFGAPKHLSVDSNCAGSPSDE